MAVRRQDIRRPDLSQVYRQKLSTIHPGDFDFRATLIGEGGDRLNLDSALTSISWEESAGGGGGEGGLEGSMTLQRPEALHPNSLPVRMSQRLLLEARGRESSWRDLFTMRTGAPETRLDGGVNVSLMDSMESAKRVKMRFVFRKSKAHPSAYDGHEIVALAARQVGLRVGSLARTSVKIGKLVRTGSLMEVVLDVYGQEQEHSGLRVLFQIQDGKLNVLPFRRNRVLYAIKDHLIEALLTEEAEVRPTTVLIGTGRIGKGKGSRVVTHREAHAGVLRRFGSVVKERNYGRVDSRSDLIEKVQRSYAYGIRVTRKATVTVPGIPFIHVPDAILLDLPSEGYRDAEAYVFCSRVSHQVSEGSYTTSLDLVATDAYARYRLELAKKRAASERKARRRAAAAKTKARRR